MERAAVSVVKNKKVYAFEVAEYPHHQHERCKINVYQNGELVAGFEPDSHEYLHLCSNPGNIDEEVLHLLADQLESYHL